MTPAQFIDDPNWADFLPEFRDPVRVRGLPEHEDCSPLEVERVERHLRRGGTLGAMEGYEERPGQLAMLAGIAECFNSRSHLMVEAGTGVGKSLAYLIPAVHWAQLNDTPVVISTATRNLQSQLIEKDIPRAVSTLGEADAAKFRVALLKGRTNYLCLRAVGDFFASGYWTMSAEDQAEMPHFIEWLKHTPDGDLDRYEGISRELLSCPGEECSSRHCPFYSRCFVYRARRLAQGAQLVVANHALVLAEAASPQTALLPAYGRLVMDEAHNLEEIATEYLSYEFSERELSRILNRLMRRGRGKRSRPGGILAAIGRQLAKGGISERPVAERVMAIVNGLSSEMVTLVNAAEALSDSVAPLLGDRAAKGPVRYLAGTIRTPETLSEHDRFESALTAMVTSLHALRDLLNESVPEGELNFFAEYAQQLDNVAQSLIAFANETAFCLEAAMTDTHVYWIERDAPPKRRACIRLVGAPLSVADELRGLLYEPKDSTVLCSATLRVGNDFKYVARRLGFGATDETQDAGRYRTLAAASPFDYFRQCVTLATDFLPDPAANPAEYVDSLSPLLVRLFARNRGRGLVLFTSYEMMTRAAAAAREGLAANGIELLVQGEGLSREAMTARLKLAESDPRAAGPVVLFGAQSFWEGVDVPGEALTMVVLTRLPFPQQGHPIVESRCEQIDRRGGSSFRDYLMNEAVIGFRQGFGRLIRTQSDRGAVIITDSRLVTRNYGGRFRKSLPSTVRTVSDAEELFAALDFGEP